MTFLKIRFSNSIVLPPDHSFHNPDDEGAGYSKLVRQVLSSIVEANRFRISNYPAYRNLFNTRSKIPGVIGTKNPLLK